MLKNWVLGRWAMICWWRWLEGLLIGCENIGENGLNTPYYLPYTHTPNFPHPLSPIYTQSTTQRKEAWKGNNNC